MRSAASKDGQTGRLHKFRIAHVWTRRLLGCSPACWVRATSAIWPLGHRNAGSRRILLEVLVR